MMDTPVAAPVPAAATAATTHTDDVEEQESDVLVFATEGPSAIHSALRVWMSSLTEPQPVHCELLAQYIHQHIEQHNLEAAQQMLEWLREGVQEHIGSGGAWSSAFNSILEHMQDQMLCTYRARFSIRPLTEL